MPELTGVWKPELIGIWMPELIGIWMPSCLLIAEWLGPTGIWMPALACPAHGMGAKTAARRRARPSDTAAGLIQIVPLGGAMHT